MTATLLRTQPDPQPNPDPPPTSPWDARRMTEPDPMPTGPIGPGPNPRPGTPPSGRATTVCTYCRRAIHRQRNGEWYHNHNASVSCRPGWASRRAAPGAPVGS